MTITIDLLSLILGLILGCCFMGFVTTFFYFDDRWHTAFGQGWECGNKYQKEQQNKADAEREEDASSR